VEKLAVFPQTKKQIRPKKQYSEKQKRAVIKLFKNPNKKKYCKNNHSSCGKPCAKLRLIVENLHMKHKNCGKQPK